jgi:hypothetical protein
VQGEGEGQQGDADGEGRGSALTVERWRSGSLGFNSDDRRRNGGDGTLASTLREREKWSQTSKENAVAPRCWGKAGGGGMPSRHTVGRALSERVWSGQPNAALICDVLAAQGGSRRACDDCCLVWPIVGRVGSRGVERSVRQKIFFVRK